MIRRGSGKRPLSIGVKVIAYDAGRGGMDSAKQFALRLVAYPATTAVVDLAAPIPHTV